MKCPHCREHFADKEATAQPIGVDKSASWGLAWRKCPACDRFIVELIVHTFSSDPNLPGSRERLLIYPRGTHRPPCPEEVTRCDTKLASDYVEACLVLTDSPQASAALSRRCLQHLLRTKAKVE